ncbi:uncharacterized protein [Mytilus edulis]|uniref:uncharacterized protein isoform X2 n=1 Tax=Mytilus edulis TaxID=6550 RepID=UPI0039EEB5A9
MCAGILLCGLGGMGKTSLANTLCYRLRGECWKTIKIELREQVTYRHFLRVSVQSIMKESNVLVSGSGIQTSDNDQIEERTDQILIEELNLRQKLLEHISEKLRRKLIILFDNLDDETTEEACATNSTIEQSKIMEFFKSLLEIMTANKDCQTRLIITSRNNFLLTTGKELRSLLLKIEVDSLVIEDARKLTSKCTKQCKLNDQQIDAIVTVCCACPLAIRVISDAINDSPNSTHIISLIQKRTDPILSPLLQIYECLSQPFEKLKENKSTLCQLSLFGTTKFDMNSAANIIFGKFETSMEKKEIIKKLTELKLTILLFKSRHLIEIENDECLYSPSGQIADIELEDLFARQKIYSLHPLVCKFLKDKADDKEIVGDIRKAKYNYIVYFDELVLNIGQEYESNFLVAREKSEKLKIHILKYIELMKEYDSFSNIQYLQTSSTSEDAKRRSQVVQMICVLENHLSFIESMISKIETRTISKLSWEIEHVAAILRYQHYFENIEGKCKQILQELNSFASNNLSEVETIQLSILKGRTYFFLGTLTTDSDPGYSEESLLEAKQIFESQKLTQRQESLSYLGDIYNGLGYLLYRKKDKQNRIKDLEKAIQMHKQALKCSSNSQNESIVIYYSNIAACHFELSTKFKNDKRTREREKSLDCYNNSVDLAKCYGMDTSDIYLRKLLDRGNVFIMLWQLEKAAKDFEECSNLVKKLYEKPSRIEILIRHAQGHLIRRKIQLGGISNDETADLVIKGTEVYEELKNILSPTLLPGNSTKFKQIRRYHMDFLRDYNDDDLVINAKRFYSAYHSVDSTNDSSGKPTISESVSSSNDEMEEPQNFKLPLSTPKYISGRDSNPATRCRASSTSSGFYSMNSSTSDIESVSSLKTNSTSRQYSWSDDDVFPKRQSSFESAVERMEDKTSTNKSSTPKSPLPKSSTTFEVGEAHNKRQLSEDDKSNSSDWNLPHKLNTEYEIRLLEANSRACDTSTKKYKKEKLEEIVNELEDLIPSVKPRMRTLVKDLDSGEAELVDDKRGRLSLQYKD